MHTGKRTSCIATRSPPVSSCFIPYIPRGHLNPTPPLLSPLISLSSLPPSPFSWFLFPPSFYPSSFPTPPLPYPFLPSSLLIISSFLPYSLPSFPSPLFLFFPRPPLLSPLSPPRASLFSLLLLLPHSLSFTLPFPFPPPPSLSTALGHPCF